MLHRYLTRCWTIFEQYIGAKLGVGIKVILPPEMMASFTTQMESGNIKQIRQSLTSFNVADAKASVPADEVKVKELISSTVGFDAVNKSVANSMQKWCASVLKAYLQDCVSTLEEDDGQGVIGDGAQASRRSSKVAPFKSDPNGDTEPVSTDVKTEFLPMCMESTTLSIPTELDLQNKTLTKYQLPSLDSS